jgi:exodeoxyribonuclease III
MRIASWNVNSVRARIENIKKYLNSSSPDILLLQEIKTEEDSYPFEELNKLGYKSYVSGQKSYNGVSILSKKKLSSINKILPGDKIKQSRIISTQVKIKNKNVDVINIYVPNGNPVDTEKYSYKLNWLDLLIKEIESKLKKNTPVILAGDFNIIPEAKDAYAAEKYENDALFRLEIRKKFRTLINLGLQDVFRYYNNSEGQYTFWDYQKGSWQKNNGLRIDHFLISNELIDLVKDINIKKNIRNQVKASDHAPIECTIG